MFCSSLDVARQRTEGRSDVLAISIDFCIIIFQDIHIYIILPVKRNGKSEGWRKLGYKKNELLILHTRFLNSSPKSSFFILNQSHSSHPSFLPASSSLHSHFHWHNRPSVNWDPSSAVFVYVSPFFSWITKKWTGEEWLKTSWAANGHRSIVWCGLRTKSFIRVFARVYSINWQGRKINQKFFGNQQSWSAILAQQWATYLDP